MTLYSKLGSYPTAQPDSTEGWVEVPNAPEIPWGKELAWLNGEWVVRNPKPLDRPGYQWNWNHAEMAWVECEYAATGDGQVITAKLAPAETGTSLSFTSVSLVSAPAISLGNISNDNS